MVTTVYPVRSVSWEAITFAASSCACELAEGGKARINGFSASPSSTVGKAGGKVAVGVPPTGVGDSVAVGVGVACARRMRGKLQFVKTKNMKSMNIVNKRRLWFTARLLRL